MDLTIQPLYCDDTTYTDTSTCYESSTSKVTIYNKRRDKFTLSVGAGLTLKNLIIDSLDSIVESKKFKFYLMIYISFTNLYELLDSLLFNR